MQAIRELKAKGKTIVLITHRPNALGVADRIVLLADGRIQAQGPRDEVLASLLKAQSAARPAPIPSALPAAS
jgi:ATP-binding cassette subfamily C exporter for protease/lipase